VKTGSILHYETIADSLAEKGYACIDNFLSIQDVQSILLSDEFKNGLLHFKKAAIGREKQINESIRGDYIQWIDRLTVSPEINKFLQKIQELMEFLNRSLFLSLKDYEVHTTIYPAGSFYQRHLDQFKASGHRKLSVICYLNKEWKEEQGGQLRIYLPEGYNDIYPIAGRLVCFRSDQIEHEVIPATRDRFSLTGWMLDFKSL
jgi:SM-20-related protein